MSNTKEISDPFTAPARPGSVAGPQSVGGGSGGGAGGGVAGKPVGAAGLVESVVSGKKALGRGPVLPDKRLFRHDKARGSEKTVAFQATKEDRMSAVQAGDMLDSIHAMFGIQNEPHEYIEAFNRALFFNHTINGASTMQNGRAMLTIEGTEFDVSMVVDKLGVDQRRFYRAFADEITAVNRRVYDSYDPYDPVASEQHGWLVQAASERHLSRCPWLAHDSADACTILSMDERNALRASKRDVLALTTNNADDTRVTARVRSSAGNNVAGYADSSR